MKPRLLLLLVTIAGLASCQSDPAATRDHYYMSGQEYLQLGKYREASIQFQNALQVDDDHLPTLLALAESREKLKDYPGAVASLGRVIESDPRNVRARLWLGRRYYLAGGHVDPGLFRKAQKAAEKVLEIEPANIEAMILLGNAYAGLQDFDRSVEALERALAIEPGNLDAYIGLATSQLRGENIAEAERVFLEAVAKHPDSVRARVGLGTFYVFSRRLVQAEETLKKAFDLAPDNRAALDALVALYLVSGKPERAEEVYQQAIAVSTDPHSYQLALADFHLAQGKVEEGVAMLRQLRANRPKDSAVGLRLARVLLDRGNQSEGSSILGEILESEPDLSEAHYLLGVSLMTREQWDSALEEFDRAIDLDPALAAAHLSKANLLQRRGLLVEAATTLRTVLDLDRNNLQARAKLAKIQALRGESNAEVEWALAEARFVLKRIPSSFDALAAQAEASLFLSNLPVARRDYQELHRRDSENPFFLNRLGRIAAREGKTEEAIGYYRQVLDVFSDPDAIYAIVEILVHQGRETAALEELDRFGARTKRQDVFHFIRGKVYAAQKDYSAAEQEFRESIELNPDYYECYIALAQTKLSQNKVEEAIGEVDALIARNDRFAPAHLQKAYYLQAANEPEAAIASYRRALDLFPSDSTSYAAAANNLAWLYFRTGGNLYEALDLARKARKLNPNDPDYADTLGRIYYQAGNYALAVNQLLFAVNRGKPGPEDYYLLGMAYYRKGDFAHAEQTLRKALEMSQAFEGAIEARQTLAELAGGS